MSYVTLWKLTDADGNMSARARIVVNDEVYDETITVPVSVTVEDDLETAINTRMAELQNGVISPSESEVVNGDTEQIITPISEVTL